MSFGGFNGPSRQRFEVQQEIRDDEIADAEAHQAMKELAREAYAARGGTPLHRFWRRLTWLWRTEERPPAG